MLRVCVASYLVGVCVSIYLSISLISPPPLNPTLSLLHSLFSLLRAKEVRNAGGEIPIKSFGAHHPRKPRYLHINNPLSPAHCCMREITRRNHSSPPLAIDARPSLVQQASKKAPSQIPFKSDGVAHLHTWPAYNLLLYSTYLLYLPPMGKGLGRYM